MIPQRYLTLGHFLGENNAIRNRKEIGISLKSTAKVFNHTYTIDIGNFKAIADDEHCKVKLLKEMDEVSDLDPYSVIIDGWDLSDDNKLVFWVRDSNDLCESNVSYRNSDVSNSRNIQEQNDATADELRRMINSSRRPYTDLIGEGE